MTLFAFGSLVSSLSVAPGLPQAPLTASPAAYVLNSLELSVATGSLAFA